jgi:hypothetical protein
MAYNSEGNGNGALYFILGGLVVVVGLGFFGYRGGYFGEHFRDHGAPSRVEQTTTTTPDHDHTTTTTTTERTRP